MKSIQAPLGYFKMKRGCSNRDLEALHCQWREYNHKIENGERPSLIMQNRGLGQISHESELEKIVEQVIIENKAAAEDFKSGKGQALTFLIGQVMKATRGRANPANTSQIIKNKINNNNPPQADQEK